MTGRAAGPSRSSAAWAAGIPLLCALALLTAVPSCRESQPAAAAEQLLPVAVATPIRDRYQPMDHFTGQFRPYEQAVIRARVSGYLEKVHFEEGDYIEAGDLMFEIDAAPFDAILAAADARVGQQEAARNLAQDRFDRFTEASGAVSKLELETRKSELAQAEADLLAARAEAEAAQLNVKYTRIHAPISGIAGHAAVTRKNFITGGSASGTLLTTIVPHDPIYCYFETDERRVLKFTRMAVANAVPGRESETRMEVEIGVSDRDDFPFRGVLTRPENQLDDGTATLQLRALVRNPDDFLTPGLFARIRIKSGPEQEVLLVRDSALGFDQSKRYLWVVDENDIVQRRTVETGDRVGMMRIIRSGISDRDRIAISNVQLLRPGTPVLPTAGEMALPSASDAPAESRSEPAQ